MLMSVWSSLHTGKKHITVEQRESVNLDDHTAYLNSIREDKSQYPYRNMMSYHRLVR